MIDVLHAIQFSDEYHSRLSVDELCLLMISVGATCIERTDGKYNNLADVSLMFEEFESLINPHASEDIKAYGQCLRALHHCTSILHVPTRLQDPAIQAQLHTLAKTSAKLAGTIVDPSLNAVCLQAYAWGVVSRVFSAKQDAELALRTAKKARNLVLKALAHVARGTAATPAPLPPFELIDGVAIAGLVPLWPSAEARFAYLESYVRTAFSMLQPRSCKSILGYVALYVRMFAFHPCCRATYPITDQPCPIHGTNVRTVGLPPTLIALLLDGLPECVPMAQRLIWFRQQEYCASAARDPSLPMPIQLQDDFALHQFSARVMTTGVTAALDNLLGYDSHSHEGLETNILRTVLFTASAMLVGTSNPNSLTNHLAGGLKAKMLAGARQMDQFDRELATYFSKRHLAFGFKELVQRYMSLDKNEIHGLSDHELLPLLGLK
jgi:hypothetical protein